LSALEKIEKGESLKIINDRRPMFLYEQLDELGYKHRTEPNEDGSFTIEITKSK
jgi:tRNA 2-thiouridine synthesizing protein A